MDLQTFINQYKGKHVDFDGAYGAQCVDIVKFWEQANGWPVITGNANQVPNNAPRDRYDWIPNSLTAVPKPGDIVVFDKGLFGPNGHIGIFVSGNALTLTCFEQNNPLGAPCQLMAHPLYRGVVGWLRAKAPAPAPEPFNLYAGRLIQNDPKLNMFVRNLVSQTLRHARRTMLGEPVDEHGLGLDVDRVMPTVYQGNDNETGNVIDDYGKATKK